MGRGWLKQFWSQSGGLSLRWPRFALLIFGVACQALTVGITLPLWLVRANPPNLPTFAVPAVDFVWPLFGSLLLVLLLPRPGMAFHWCLLILAAVFDQYRLQPQFYANAVLMSVCVWPSWHNFTRWFLVSTWLWAGLHKLVSSDWYGHASYLLLRRSGVEDAEDYNLAFAIIVAVSEISVGVLACARPRWATIGCVPMHLGIMLMLSPLALNWNESVLPWNAAMALIGGWVMWTTLDAWPREPLNGHLQLDGWSSRWDFLLDGWITVFVGCCIRIPFREGKSQRLTVPEGSEAGASFVFLFLMRGVPCECSLSSRRSQESSCIFQIHAIC